MCDSGHGKECGLKSGGAERPETWLPGPPSTLFTSSFVGTETGQTCDGYDGNNLALGIRRRSLPPVSSLYFILGRDRWFASCPACAGQQKQAVSSQPICWKVCLSSMRLEVSDLL